MEWAIKILTAIGSLIGTILGIYNFLHTRRKEKEERQQNDADWHKYIVLRAAMKQEKAESFFPDEEDADEQRWAERMVAKGLLERGMAGDYLLPQGK
jgi:hypothetical protein